MSYISKLEQKDVRGKFNEIFSNANPVFARWKDAQLHRDTGEPIQTFGCTPSAVKKAKAAGVTDAQLTLLATITEKKDEAPYQPAIFINGTPVIADIYAGNKLRFRGGRPNAVHNLSEDLESNDASLNELQDRWLEHLGKAAIECFSSAVPVDARARYRHFRATSDARMGALLHADLKALEAELGLKVEVKFMPVLPHIQLVPQTENAPHSWEIVRRNGQLKNAKTILEIVTTESS